MDETVCAFGCEDSKGNPLVGIYFFQAPCGCLIHLCGPCAFDTAKNLMNAGRATCKGVGRCRKGEMHIVPVQLALVGGMN